MLDFPSDQHVTVRMLFVASGTCQPRRSGTTRWNLSDTSFSISANNILFAAGFVATATSPGLPTQSAQFADCTNNGVPLGEDRDLLEATGDGYCGGAYVQLGCNRCVHEAPWHRNCTAWRMYSNYPSAGECYSDTCGDRTTNGHTRAMELTVRPAAMDSITTEPAPEQEPVDVTTLAGTWYLGNLGQTCTSVCSGQGFSCTDGDWGVNDETSVRAAVAAAGADPETLCDGTGTPDFGSSRWCGAPYVHHYMGVTCNYLNLDWPSSQCGGVVSPSISPTVSSCSEHQSNVRRLCLCGD
eukprot:COSAG02_NODE_5546_length_4239_cov_6.329469_3_plen_297_part_00